MTARLTLPQVWFIPPSERVLNRTGASKLNRTEELGVTWRYEAGAIVMLTAAGHVKLPGGKCGRLSPDCQAIPCDGKPERPERYPAVDQSFLGRKVVAK